MAGRSAKHVLVVDDEPELRKLLAHALKAEDVEVTTAASGEEAIRLARRTRPDLIVTDVVLGDGSGLDVLDVLRGQVGELPAVVITGYVDARTLTEASRRRPVELMTKPLDVERLRSTVTEALDRQRSLRRSRRRAKRLRKLARTVNLERKNIHRQLETTCAELTTAYRSLSVQLALQEVVIRYQRDLVSARSDDDIFRALFGLFVRHSGVVFGVTLVCDENAQLHIVGRFGVPGPDSLAFCQKLSRPIVDKALVEPRCALLDAAEKADMFCESIRPYLTGVTILAVPLIPAEGQMIGVVVLYRKGEQPFTDADLALAAAIAPPTALAVQRND